MFNEANTVRDYVRDLLTSIDVQFIPGAELPRTTSDVLMESELRAALLRLNPEIDDPAKADEVIYKLRAILISARTTPHPVVANEEFAAWLTGAKSMPFGKNGEHVTIRMIDFDRPDQVDANQWTVSTEVTFKQGRVEKRFDLVLWCNGIPLVVGEAKTATNSAFSWIDGAAQVHDDYEMSVPQFFVPNVLSFATEGKDLRYGSVGMPIEKWGPWRHEDDEAALVLGLSAVRTAVAGALMPASVLEFLRFFTVFANDSKHRRIKNIARYQQFQATNLIVERVLQGETKKGLIWHFQGSGKSLLMVFTAMKLRAMAALTNPTILIVVDRRELDTQITGTFSSADVPGLAATESRAELKALLSQGARKIIVTTIQKFGEIEGVLDDRDNIIAMVDEAHRSQEGDFGRKMRQALPNAYLFGLTGTPINKRDRNTFMWFGSDRDEGGYLSRYSFAASIRDGATLPLHFEPRLSEIHIDQEGIDQAFDELIAAHDTLSEADKVTLSKKAASIEVLIKAPDRVRQIAADIAEHYLTRVEPQGFKAQVVVYDKHSCVAYKAELDKYLQADASTIVMSKARTDPASWAKWTPDAAETESLLKRFNDPADPLKIVIVTARLLTGFDAPILQAQYLDKPLKDHTLLQAITRTNRTYPSDKTHGLIVDYLGVFDDVAKSLTFDDESVQKVISNIAALKSQFPKAMAAALAFFPGVDRTVGGYEGLDSAQTALGSDQGTKDAFGLAFSMVTQLWDAISPDPMLGEFEGDYRWLVDVYESVRPVDTAGRLIWHALGRKTIDLISKYVQVEVPQAAETIKLDADTIEDLLSGDSSKTDPKEIEKQITARIARHLTNPVFVELGKRLNDLRKRYAEGQQSSLDFLRSLLELARDTVAAEKALSEVPREERGKAALTELFEAIKGDDTPVIVERVVDRIDEVVRGIRFDGWQSTSEGDREVKQALRRTLYIQFKIRDEDVFEKALGYVREYY